MCQIKRASSISYLITIVTFVRFLTFWRNVQLVNVQLGVKVIPTDISITRRLRTKKDVKGPPPIIVRFTNMKVRDAVYKARSALKTPHSSGVY